MTPTSSNASALHRDLTYLRAGRASMRITEADPSPSTVMFGSRVTIERDGKKAEMALVGEDEADPARALLHGRPLARPLLGFAVGKTLELETASVCEIIEVLQISAL